MAISSANEPDTDITLENYGMPIPAA